MIRTPAVLRSPATSPFFPLLLGTMLLAACGPRGEKAVRVSSMEPEGETVRQTNITLAFSRPVVPAERVSVLLDSTAVRIEPELPARFQWIDVATLRILPTRELAPATEYAVRVLPGIIEQPGITLVGRKEFRLRTPPLRIVRGPAFMIRTPDDPESGVFNVSFEFSESVSPEDLASHLEIAPAPGQRGGPVPFRVTTTEPGIALEVQSEPVHLGEQDGEMVVTVRPGLRPLGGLIPTRDPWQTKIPYRAHEELKVESVRPEQMGRDFTVVVALSSPVEMQQAHEYISIDPAVEFRIAEGGTRLRLTGGFQAGNTYTVTIAQGLTARDGARLSREFSGPVVLRNLEPSLGFESPGTYLAREGLKNVAIEVVNLSEFHLEVFKVYANNLVYYLANPTSWNMRQMGRRILERDVSVQIPSNQPTLVTLDLSTFLEEHPVGLFHIFLRAQGRFWQYIQKTVLVTDIGLIAKRGSDALNVWALNTTTLEPQSGVEVTLWSNTNQSMGSARTDADGQAVITGLAEQADEFEPYVLTARRREDTSFLLFEQCGVSTADFEVGGRPFLDRGYEAFLYTERGVYRPGESVHLAAMVRGPRATVPPSFPVRVSLLRPDGRTLTERQSRTLESGLLEFALEIPASAPTGRYQAQLFAAGESPIGNASFSVEEFMPDRMRVEVIPERTSWRTGEELAALVRGTMFFGPPAAGCRLDATLTLEAAPFRPTGFGSFTFGDPRATFAPESIEIGSRELDGKGEAPVRVRLPVDLLPPAMLRGILTASVRESGGRAVTRSAGIDVHPYSTYPGIRRTAEGYADVGQAEELDFVVLDPNGTPLAGRTVTARLLKINWQTSLVRDTRGVYRYQSERTEIPFEEVQVVSGPEPVSFSFTPREWGLFVVRLTDPASGGSCATEFYASGWGFTPWSMDQPDRVGLELDRPVYRAGDRARVLIKAPFPGRLLLTVERERVLQAEWIVMEENTAEVTLTTREEWGPNVYVTASLVRSVSSGDSHAPRRAWGTAPLAIDMTQNRLTIAVAAPATTRPKSPLEVSLRIQTAEGNRPAGPVHLTLAAVDEGILQLTDFRDPNPMDFFYGRRRLEVTSYDLFALLLPEQERSEVYSLPGGDRASALRMEHLSAGSVRRVKPVALWSGWVDADTDGTTRIRFDLPEFNGRLRLAAVAAAGGKFGTGIATVTVSDPIVLTPTLPRFLTAGDAFRMPVQVYNSTGATGVFQLALEVEGPVAIEGETRTRVELAAGAEGSAIFRVRSRDVQGTAIFRLTAEGGGARSTVTTEVPLRPASPPSSVTGAGSVHAGEDVTFDLPADWVAGTARVVVSVDPFPSVSLSGDLQDLLHYPYGCVEQITSQVFPLLYFRDLARVVDPALFTSRAPEYFVEEGIRRILGMQTNAGSFALWPGGEFVNEWASLYALHLLIEARRAGFSVPDQPIRDGALWAREMLTGQLRPWQRPAGFYIWSASQQLRTQAYAAYVLALAGRPERGVMNLLLTSRLDDLSLEGRMLLAGAFALSGDTATAFRLLPSSVRPAPAGRETGHTFGSAVRDNAIVLSVLADVAPDHAAVPDLVRYLCGRAGVDHWWSTQETAWSLLALGKVMQRAARGTYTGQMFVDGRERAPLSPDPLRIEDPALAGHAVRLHVEGEGLAWYFWEVRGTPTGQRFTEQDQGLQVRRRFLDLGGHPVPTDSLRHGDLYVTELRIKALQQNLENVVVDDMLPSGLEIENPRLSGRGTIDWVEQQSTLTPDYLDIRDDRLLLFCELTAGKEARYFYTVRAVTEGVFVLPPVSAECMYDGSIRSIASSGGVRVLRP